MEQTAIARLETPETREARELETINWQAIGRALSAPFAPESIEWRPQGKPAAHKRVQLVPYVDARDVQDRLDEVAGVGGWSFELEPIVVAGNELQVARGRLTILGVTKDDVGTASNFEASKGCASDALKRAAVQFGIARYLYRLPPVWVTLSEDGNVPTETLEKLRTRLGALAAASGASSYRIAR